MYAISAIEMHALNFLVFRVDGKHLNKFKERRDQRKNTNESSRFCTVLRYLSVASVICRVNDRHDIVRGSIMTTIAVKNRVPTSVYSRPSHMEKQSSPRRKTPGFEDAHMGRVEVLALRKKHPERIQASVLGLVALHFLSTMALVSSQLIGSGTERCRFVITIQDCSDL